MQDCKPKASSAVLCKSHAIQSMIGHVCNMSITCLSHACDVHAFLFVSILI